jgi:hypothetical protein
MRLSRLLPAACALIALPLLSAGWWPAPPDALPVGKWSVEIANGIAQACEFRRDGTATVAEPGRAAGARVTPLAGALLVVYEDDRVERWTPVGRRMVVEH